MNRGEYIAPTVTVDVVSLRWRHHVLTVATHRRQRDPFAGQWALPGCYYYEGDDPEERAQAVLADRCGVEAGRLRQVSVSARPGRDTRGPSLSIIYLETGTSPHPENIEPPTAFDHAEIIGDVLGGTRPIALDVCAELVTEFTITELFDLYRQLGGPVDNRANFGRTVKPLVRGTGARVAGQGRPAELHVWA